MKKFLIVVLATSALVACGVAKESSHSDRNLPKRVTRAEGSLNATAPFATQGNLVLDVTYYPADPSFAPGQAKLPVCYGPLDAATAIGEVTCADNKTIAPVVIKAGQVRQICNGDRTFVIEPTAKLELPVCAQPFARVYDFEPQLDLKNI